MTLVHLWLITLGLAGLAVAVMLVLVVLRLIRMQLSRRRQRARSRMLPLILAAVDSEDNEARLRAARKNPGVMADMAVELFELVRGDDSARYAALFERLGVLDVLRRRLARGDERARTLAAETLAFFHGDIARKALDAALGDPSLDVRLAAAIALADLGTTPPLRRLVRMLDQGRADPSRRLVDLFRRMTGARAPELLEIARDRGLPTPVRAAFVEALATTGSYALVPAFAEIAGRAQEDGAPELVAECVRSVGVLRHPGGWALVELALGSRDWQVRAEAAEAAGRGARHRIYAGRDRHPRGPTAGPGVFPPARLRRYRAQAAPAGPALQPALAALQRARPAGVAAGPGL